MIYLYDNAICSDLKKSFNPDNTPNPVVSVIDPEGAITIAAQMQNDEVKYPLVVLSRDPDPKIDTERYNFTRAKRGVVVGFDKVSNELLSERAIPMSLNYKLTAITTSTVDMDEIMKELLFKYSDMYFLSIELPYEIKRRIRFGVRMVPDTSVSTTSATFDYLSAGTLYESSIQLECLGCVWVSYNTSKLRRMTTEITTSEDLK